MVNNYLLCGVGGQGTILASKLIAATAMKQGLSARTAETIGMAQRGGSVVSHVRTGEQIYSPLIPKGQADLIIGFEPAEAVRMLHYLKPGGNVVVSQTPLKPVKTSRNALDYTAEEMIRCLQKQAQNVVVIDADEICRACKTAKVLNVALLGGAVSAGYMGITREGFLQTLKEQLRPAFHEVNEKAFMLGANAVSQMR